MQVKFYTIKKIKKIVKLLLDPKYLCFPQATPAAAATTQEVKTDPCHHYIGSKPYKQEQIYLFIAAIIRNLKTS